ncbi:MAG: PD40 domain-containing protein [Candidatus Hydrogenedentes bacterium]|nr:PD40 domain-containing protein [Candidatus Hydrogenedentota bacterium]
MTSSRALLAAWCAVVFALAHSCATSGAPATGLSGYLIGYTEFRTNLPGGRQPNIATMRACVVRADGKSRRMLAEELVADENSWTQFAGWSPDGRYAIIGSGWESPENAAWEEEHKTFRMTEGWRYDTSLLELRTGRLENLTAIERVSDYNTGLFFFPDDPNKLGFQALIEGVSHPFTMDRDGRNKRDISSDNDGFTYGYSASPDGSRVAYHKDYQIYIANADGSQPLHIETGQPFNFVPQWSPDGAWLLFVSGEHYDCHPTIVRPDGSGLRTIAKRGGYSGVTAFLDVEDFHGGSSDVPVWSKDGKWVYYTCQVEDRVELMRVSLEGTTETLTQSPPGKTNYHPTPSPDGKWLAFGSNRTGTRQLYAMPAEGGEAQPITSVAPGCGAMWPYWRPGTQTPSDGVR